MIDKKIAWRKTWHFVRLPVIVILIIYFGFVLTEVKWPVSKERSDALVAEIHAQHLTMKDVDGSNLPPKPDPRLNGATVAGIDSNRNGIRDDVELAIFEKYPNNAKIRAAAIQYALTLQTRLEKTINAPTWQASVYEKSRAYTCVADSTGFVDGVARLKATSEVTDYVSSLMINTERRKEYDRQLERYATSAGEVEENACDVY